MLGLLERLGEREALTVKKIAPVPIFSGLKDRLGAPGSPYDFVIGAGRQTHTSIWWLGYLHRMPRVLIMRPQFLGHGADLRIVPAHDGCKPNEHTFVTQGPMNRVQAQDNPNGRPLAMIGGESKHFEWDSDRIFEQLMQWLDANPGAQVFDSRRTPSLLSSRLQSAVAHQFVHWQDSMPGSLADFVSSAPNIFVTPDSASMVFEAWSTHAQVTVAQLTDCGTRVAQAVMLGPASRPLNEAYRAAEWLSQKLQPLS